MTTDENTSAREAKEFLTMTVGKQLFGVPVLKVQDVLGEQKVTRIPLSRPEIEGSLNLRGRIVTAINLRRRLGMPPVAEGQLKMSIVVEHHNDLYSLVVDSVGEVLPLSDSNLEKTPATLDPAWRELSCGIYRLKDELLVILDVSGMLDALCIKDDMVA